MGLLILILNQCGIGVELALCNGDVLLRLSPSVGAIAILIGHEHGGSLACAHEVPIALAFAHELEVALIDDVVLRNALHSLQTGTLAHLADILSSRGGAATRLQQQLGGIQQLIARVVGLTLFKTLEETEVEDGGIAAQVALAELVVGFYADGQEAPTANRRQPFQAGRQQPSCWAR